MATGINFEWVLSLYVMLHIGLRAQHGAQLTQLEYFRFKYFCTAKNKTVQTSTRRAS